LKKSPINDEFMMFNISKTICLRIITIAKKILLMAFRIKLGVKTFKNMKTSNGTKNPKICAILIKSSYGITPMRI
jgi:hypothetical protein